MRKNRGEVEPELNLAIMLKSGKRPLAIALFYQCCRHPQIKQDMWCHCFCSCQHYRQRKMDNSFLVSIKKWIVNITNREINKKNVINSTAVKIQKPETKTNMKMWIYFNVELYVCPFWCFVDYFDVLIFLFSFFDLRNVSETIIFFILASDVFKC